MNETSWKEDSDWEAYYPYSASASAATLAQQRAKDEDEE